MKLEANKLNDENLHAITTSFEHFDFPQNTYDLASTMFALPFTDPKHFTRVFEKIKSSLNPDGIFCGQFFGTHDAWSINTQITFHTINQIKDLLADLEIISIKEIEKDGVTVNGTSKHWHLFHVIAKKI